MISILLFLMIESGKKIFVTIVSRSRSSLLIAGLIFVCGPIIIKKENRMLLRIRLFPSYHLNFLKLTM